MEIDNKPQVYISYSRSEEDRTSTIDYMEEKLPTVSFNTDIKEVKDQEDFQFFIEKIGTAEKLIVIFSEAYMKSFHCMSELALIVEHGGDLKKRVFFIRDTEYVINEKQTTIKAYWKEMVDYGDSPRPKPTEAGTPKEVKQIYDSLDNTLGAFRTWNAQTAKELRKESYRSFLHWLKGDKKSLLDPRQRSFSGDLNSAQKKLLSYLNDQKIRTALEAHFDIKGTTDSNLLLEKLCPEDSEQLMDMLHNELKDTVTTLKNEANYLSELKESIRQFASLLSVFVVNKSWVDNFDLSKGIVIEIPSDHGFSAAIGSARLGETHPVLSAKKNNDKVTCEGEVVVRKKLGSWDDSDVIKYLVALVWNQVYPEGSQKRTNDTDSALEEISDKDMQAFSNHLLRMKEHFYLNIPTGEAYQYLQSDTLMNELMTTFPALTVFKRITATDTEYVIANDGDLKLAYQQFLAYL